MRHILIVFAALCLLASPAYAYIGPGLGTGVVATVLGILGSFALALFAVVWYPLKRLVKKLRRSKNNSGK